MFRILVVDDTPMNLDITSRMLLKAGYGVDTAVNGEEAVKMAGLWRYDLIVMDMAMPDISGSEATKMIRSAESDSGTRRVPVVAFTANANDEVRQRALRSDMDDFITKPIERRQLLAAVERSLDDRAIFLVADDCTPDRERTLLYLRGLENVGIVGAGTAAAAVAICSRQRITFALIAESLPDMGGAEAIRQIRASRDGDSIGIIPISGKADPEARNQSLTAGYAGFLEKPYGRAELLKEIQSLLTVHA